MSGTISTLSDEQRNDLRLALRYDDLDGVRIFLDNGFDVNADIVNGDTMLTQAAANGSEAVVRYLIEQGADVNLGDYNNRTALSYAAARGDLSIMKMLLDVGADPNVQETIDCERHTALSRAVWSAQKEAIALLIDAGVDTTVGVADGYGAIDYAGTFLSESNKKEEIIQMLKDAPARQKFLVDEKVRIEEEKRAAAAHKESVRANALEGQARLRLKARRQKIVIGPG